MAYDGSIYLASGIAPKPGLNYPVADAADIRVNDSTRLSAKLTTMDGQILNRDTITSVNNKLALKAPLASPALTGNATAEHLALGNDPVDAMDAATKQYVDNAFAVNDAMLYKGVVNSDSDLPATHKQGWTYKVGTNGIYAGHVCEVGDMLICNTDGTAADNSHWDAVQSGDGSVVGPNASVANDVALFDGTNGKVIKDGGTIQSLILNDSASDGEISKAWSVSKARREATKMLPFAVCSTAGDTGTKAISLQLWSADSDFTAGTRVLVRFINQNEESGATLSINYDGTHTFSAPIWYEGGALTSSNADVLNGICLLVFNGTQWEMTPFSNTDKADKLNPVFEGALSNGRSDGSPVGARSFAFGANASATNAYAHSEGFNTSASGMFSHAEGVGTTAASDSQFVFGKYNVSDNLGTYLEIVGNGTAPNSLSNARALSVGGNEYLKGTLYVKCNAQSGSGTEVLSEANIAVLSDAWPIIDGYVG